MADHRLPVNVGEGGRLVYSASLGQDDAEFFLPIFRGMQGVTIQGDRTGLEVKSRRFEGSMSLADIKAMVSFNQLMHSMLKDEHIHPETWRKYAPIDYFQRAKLFNWYMCEPTELRAVRSIERKGDQPLLLIMRSPRGEWLIPSSAPSQVRVSYFGLSIVGHEGGEDYTLNPPTPSHIIDAPEPTPPKKSSKARTRTAQESATALCVKLEPQPDTLHLSSSATPRPPHSSPTTNVGLASSTAPKPVRCATRPTFGQPSENQDFSISTGQKAKKRRSVDSSAEQSLADSCPPSKRLKTIRADTLTQPSNGVSNSSSNFTAANNTPSEPPLVETSSATTPRPAVSATTSSRLKENASSTPATRTKSATQHLPRITKNSTAASAPSSSPSMPFVISPICSTTSVASSLAAAGSQSRQKGPPSSAQTAASTSAAASLQSPQQRDSSSQPMASTSAATSVTRSQSKTPTVPPTILRSTPAPTPVSQHGRRQEEIQQEEQRDDEEMPLATSQSGPSGQDSSKATSAGAIPLYPTSASASPARPPLSLATDPRGPSSSDRRLSSFFSPPPPPPSTVASFPPPTTAPYMRRSSSSLASAPAALQSSPIPPFPQSSLSAPSASSSTSAAFTTPSSAPRIIQPSPTQNAVAGPSRIRKPSTTNSSRAHHSPVEQNPLVAALNGIPQPDNVDRSSMRRPRRVETPMEVDVPPATSSSKVLRAYEASLTAQVARVDSALLKSTSQAPQMVVPNHSAATQISQPMLVDTDPEASVDQSQLVSIDGFSIHPEWRERLLLVDFNQAYRARQDGKKSICHPSKFPDDIKNEAALEGLISLVAAMEASAMEEDSKFLALVEANEAATSNIRHRLAILGYHSTPAWSFLGQFSTFTDEQLDNAATSMMKRLVVKTEEEYEKNERQRQYAAARRRLTKDAKSPAKKKEKKAKLEKERKSTSRRTKKSDASQI